MRKDSKVVITNGTDDPRIVWTVLVVSRTGTAFLVTGEGDSEKTASVDVGDLREVGP